MKLRSIEVEACRVPLVRPYAIAYATTSEVELFLLRVESADGAVGLGAATPEPSVTGESVDDCRAALAPERTAILLANENADERSLLARVARDWRATPAAAAALDIALHDLRASRLGVPLVEHLGRVHPSLPTSVTIGIRALDDTLAEAREHAARGFRALKLKIGSDLDADLSRLRAVRAAVGEAIALRVDANCGYRPGDVPRLLTAAGELAVEIVEQPVAPADDEELARLLAGRARHPALLADESVLDAADAARLVAGGLYDGFVVKLMKCGGIAPARQIAEVARAAGRRLMWGCMDESVVGISAALHAALASPATAWLDLDGSFDLARDPACGGFALVDGHLTTIAEPGLGVEVAR